LRKIGAWLEGSFGETLLKEVIEHPAKGLLLNCRDCGDCAIQHVGFLCPESGCPKHMRNGACGGSSKGRCEVNPDRICVWVRAYDRLARFERTGEMITGCIPPRMWELNQTSSWFNYHLQRDHQSSSCAIARRCRLHTCRIE
jgi:methylenetetrahydrofolate reductase (NADPH)